LELGALEALIAESPSELYERGLIDACLRRTAGATSTADRTIRVRALIRKGRYLEALDAIAGVERATADEDAVLLALKAECHCRRGAVGLARAALGGIRLREYGPEVGFKIAYARMLIAWVEDDPGAMSAALQNVDITSAPHLYGRWLHARSWAAAARGNYREQLQLLEAAIAHLVETPGERDVWLLASATRALVHLVREISASDATFEFAVRVVASMAWTEDLEVERFLTFRGLAWAYALRGSHRKAFQYIYFARDIAPSAKWVTACYADLAYLSMMAGEERSAAAVLDHAVTCALETDWSSDGEERVALLNLIELVADRDPATSRSLLSIYQGISVGVSPGLSLAHGRRLGAMEDYAQGVVLAVSGDPVAARERLSNAYASFSSIGYAWRAAAAALRLHDITEEDVWLQSAGEAVREFPESSVAGEIRQKAAVVVADPREAALTPAQRRVFALICDGLSDKQIANALGISPETAKNHAARVRAAFGVHSRAALMATARHSVRAV
jgi:DNA-binding CsgD family transcriptional regulator/tetratricopeptide (TPR) repeat protein